MHLLPVLGVASSGGLAGAVWPMPLPSWEASGTVRFIVFLGLTLCKVKINRYPVKSVFLSYISISVKGFTIFLRTKLDNLTDLRSHSPSLTQPQCWKFRVSTEGGSKPHGLRLQTGSTEASLGHPHGHLTRDARLHVLLSGFITDASA